MIANSASIAASAHVDPSANIWDQVQIRDNADIGPNVIIGRGAYVGTGVKIGANSKIQNYALVYEPAELAEGVFIGPAAVLTNDKHPRAINPDGSRKSATDWEAVGVRVGTGASIGARAVCVAPIEIGAWAMIAAGAVVVSDVLPYALMVGVPARQVGWVGPAGAKLLPVDQSEQLFECPLTRTRYAVAEVGGLIAQ